MTSTFSSPASTMRSAMNSAEASTSTACSGWAEMDGMRSHSNRVFTMRSRSVSTYSASARSGMAGTLGAGRLDAVNTALVADLERALAPDRVRVSPLELDLYARDASIISGKAEVVCFPVSAVEVQACVRVCRKHGRPFVPRGSGTGLAGGAVPVGDPVVIVTTKMTRILEVDADERVAWVEPGVLNLDLTRAVTHLGLHYAPDPSSQQSCSIGGNVATNSGGPHCLLYGVTSAHVVAVEVCLPDGSLVLLGGPDPAPSGYDLPGAL